MTILCIVKQWQESNMYSYRDKNKLQFVYIVEQGQILDLCQHKDHLGTGLRLIGEQ
jgi:hypothetical protein